MTIATVLAATFSISVSAQEFLAGSGTPGATFPIPIARSPTLSAQSGTAKRSARLPAKHNSSCVCWHQIRDNRRGYWRRQRLLLLWLSPIVGPHGHIIAEDVVPKYLRGLRRRVRDLGLRNVVISLGDPHDPRLPTNSLDIAILVHMYHEITHPYGLLYNLVPALKPGARVGVVSAYGPTSKHGTPQIFYAVSLQP